MSLQVTKAILHFQAANTRHSASTGDTRILSFTTVAPPIASPPLTITTIKVSTSHPSHLFLSLLHPSDETYSPRPN